MLCSALLRELQGLEIARATDLRPEGCSSIAKRLPIALHCRGMNDLFRKREEALMERIRELGDQARADLEEGRKTLSQDEFKQFHRRTVDALNKAVEQIVGLSFERE